MSTRDSIASASNRIGDSTYQGGQGGSIQEQLSRLKDMAQKMREDCMKHKQAQQAIWEAKTERREEKNRLQSETRGRLAQMVAEEEEKWRSPPVQEEMDKWSELMETIEFNHEERLASIVSVFRVVRSTMLDNRSFSLYCHEEDALEESYRLKETKGQ
ncbi:hypothetical protein JAAARDRAFT_462718 [Jaapia argillacea MUCL 33604]|uniref:Uncharacterized protein n=1 Tax=Jaapia argillacea MUCL 33604 TaxID=933084 RepID=A0A067QG84_9AGAM|nr:hypothetical protein JAAARDRAFT_462718 [Jaapia argillacea MUCL 33604]